ncbi:hypothetical protein PR001_g14874 [Phytophthora rubi]|uniref:DUF7769 domain-containing protein n=2 Tax=Phytophthora rubi TaxID=129364 RepID=A0A6A3LA61_9STRA|nr:hypothetical protein PR001_g14874 [Phytophthora rubi]
MKQATGGECQVIWETCLLRSDNGKLEHGGMTEIAGDFGISRDVVSRIWKRGCSTMGERVAAVVKPRWSQCGRKKKDRAELCKLIREIPIRDRCNYRTIQARTILTPYLIKQLQEEGFMRHALTRTEPLLTEKHRHERLKWCVSHVRQMQDGGCSFVAMDDTVHVDEKWFFLKKVGQKVYILTGLDGEPCEEAPVQYLQSKRHIVKVMFLCAVARPRGDWDGKVGIWPVVEGYVTQRKSVNRDAGVIELRPVTMTREIYRRMLIEDVILAIKSKWEWIKDAEHGVPLKVPIRLQQDNAKPHVLPHDPEVMALGCSDGWKILVTAQPAQSPDLNALDCGFFHAIQSLQSFTTPRSTVDLIKEVEEAFQNTTYTTLNKTFLSIQLIMANIMKHDGGNSFPLSHFHKDKLLRAGKLLVAIPCDAALYLSALSKVVPQVAPLPTPSEFDVFLW